MAMNNIDDQYKVPLIAKLLHSLPHYNITFHRTNNTFRPTDEGYLEVSVLFIPFSVDDMFTAQIHIDTNCLRYRENLKGIHKCGMEN